MPNICLLYTPVVSFLTKLSSPLEQTGEKSHKMRSVAYHAFPNISPAAMSMNTVKYKLGPLRFVAIMIYPLVHSHPSAKNTLSHPEPSVHSQLPLAEAVGYKVLLGLFKEHYK